MTFEMKRTAFKEYTTQYEPEIVKPLNEVYNNGPLLSNEMIDKAGRSISPDCVHTMHPQTSDGYDWFAGLEFPVMGGRVAILFPWCQDKDPKSRLDRSINVYSAGSAFTEDVRGLLKKIEDQLSAQKNPQKRGAR
jgi:hypothetical protein